MHVEMRQISSIKPYDNNPRINDPAVDAVAASIKEFGFNQPLVVDEQGVIIVGDTRYKAARKLGMEIVPVYVAVGLSAAKARAYRIADNQTATLSRVDDGRLVEELLASQGMDYDLSQTGFGEEEILRLLRRANQCRPRGPSCRRSGASPCAWPLDRVRAEGTRGRQRTGPPGHARSGL